MQRRPTGRFGFLRANYSQPKTGWSTSKAGCLAPAQAARPASPFGVTPVAPRKAAAQDDLAATRASKASLRLGSRTPIDHVGTATAGTAKGCVRPRSAIYIHNEKRRRRRKPSSARGGSFEGIPSASAAITRVSKPARTIVHEPEVLELSALASILARCFSRRGSSCLGLPLLDLVFELPFENTQLLNEPKIRGLVHAGRTFRDQNIRLLYPARHRVDTDLVVCSLRRSQ